MSNSARSMQYQFTLIELHIDKNGKGGGKLVPAAKVSWDTKAKKIEIDNYNALPVDPHQRHGENAVRVGLFHSESPGVEEEKANMAKIGFLGLGEMGTPMARRLLQAGHELLVWNRSAERTAPLAQEGAAVASSPARAAPGRDFVITMLATPDALEQVLFGSEGLAPALSPGQVLIDMSTVGPQEVHAAAARLPKGASLVDAPVRGSVPQATSGRLEIFVGASDQDYERVRPILETLGSVRHSGGPGSGAAMKLVANLALGAAMVTLGEALALGESLELQQNIVLDVLADSPIGPIVKAKRANVESSQFAPSFKLRHAAKDLRLVTETAAAKGRDLKQAKANRAWLDEAAEHGAADLDFSAVVATIGREKSSADRPRSNKAGAAEH